ncbi:uncharacterized protein FIBRA_09101 [Fibroporia radiculosa]|uniref:Uncharacterized protein n=1 Tax=Fibroporia radiculosa TaxID=599839 RepID=J4ICQ1_9APHY|nr:uncharacterized protein FIBRA_09101 [Fibroporia radiculosa]CCM06801.1 predicted protein [Fibroporia radiculosa]
MSVLVDQDVCEALGSERKAVPGELGRLLAFTSGILAL